MLNISGGELLIILLVALIFLGPQRLPTVARQVGQTVSSLRGLARGFQAELEAAARPDPLPGPAATASTPVPTDQSATPPTDIEDLRAKAREAGFYDPRSEKPVAEDAPVDLTASDEEE